LLFHLWNLGPTPSNKKYLVIILFRRTAYPNDPFGSSKFYQSLISQSFLFQINALKGTLLFPLFKISQFRFYTITHSRLRLFSIETLFSRKTKKR
jgi:hypothetical protein